MVLEVPQRERMWGWFEPEFDLFVYDTNAGSNARIAETVMMQCPCCGHKMTQDVRERIHQGYPRTCRWLKDGQTIDRYNVVSGEGEKNDIASFWLKGAAAFAQCWKSHGPRISKRNG